ncbi:hypothetical protein OF846_003915 [Rhodotorula toruloides]|nr:hypothetical protein OF846_003915 [Rhodotorula toruloides]
MAAVLVSVRTTRYPAGSRLAPTVGRQLVRDAKPRRKRSKAGGEAQDEEDVKPPPRKKRKAGFTPEGSLSFASFLLLASLRVAIDEAWLPAYTSTKTPALDALIAAYDTFSAGPNKQIVSAVESKLRKTPYIYLPYRELHTHRRLPPPNLSSSTPQQQFEHHVLLRTGLIAAPKALYRSLPCEGLHSGTVDAWFGSERVQAWYETRGIRQGEEGTNGWGRTNCYGSNARGISFDKRDVFLARRSEVFAAVHGLPFCDALTALHAAALPVFSVGSISGYLAVADLALSGLIQKPKKDEMG